MYYMQSVGQLLATRGNYLCLQFQVPKAYILIKGKRRYIKYISIRALLNPMHKQIT